MNNEQEYEYEQMTKDSIVTEDTMGVIQEFDKIYIYLGGEIPDDVDKLIVFNELETDEKITLLLEMILVIAGATPTNRNVYFNSYNIGIIGLEHKIKEIKSKE